jgi:hypothetical protein
MQENKFAEWRNVSIPSISKYIYINELIIAPIKLNITFNKKTSLNFKSDEV